MGKLRLMFDPALFHLHALQKAHQQRYFSPKAAKTKHYPDQIIRFFEENGEYFSVPFQKIQHYLSTHHGKIAESDLDIFNTEIGRAEEDGSSAYRYDGLTDIPITLENFKRGLISKNISDEAEQTAILISLMQNQGSIGFALPLAIGLLITDLAGLAGITHAIQTDQSTFQRHQLKIKRDSTNAINLEFSQKIILRNASNGSSTDVGKIDFTVKIAPGKNILELSHLMVTVDEGNIVHNNLRKNLLALHYKPVSVDQKRQRHLLSNDLEAQRNASTADVELALMRAMRPKPQPSFFNKVVHYVKENPFKCAAIAGAVVLGVAGVALTATGVLAPLGIALGAAGIKLGVMGVGAIALNALFSTAVGAATGIIGAGIGIGMEKLKGLFSRNKPVLAENPPSGCGEETFYIHPGEKIVDEYQRQFSQLKHAPGLHQPHPGSELVREELEPATLERTSAGATGFTNTAK